MRVRTCRGRCAWTTQRATCAYRASSQTGISHCGASHGHTLLLGGHRARTSVIYIGDCVMLSCLRASFRRPRFSLRCAGIGRATQTSCSHCAARPGSLFASQRTYNEQQCDEKSVVCGLSCVVCTFSPDEQATNNDEL